MAKQITQLPVAASVAASDVFPLDQSGTTKQATLTAIAAGLPAGTGTGGLVREVYPSFFSGLATNGVNGFSATGAWSCNGGDTFGPTGGGFVSFYGASHPVSPGLLQLGTNGGGLINVLPSGNIGLGTTTPTQRLSVNGNIDCSTLFSQSVSVINNFPQVTCTTSAGYGWRFHNTSSGASLGYCIIQGTTDNFASSFINGFQINTNGSCVIGPGSSAVQNVYTAVAFLSPPAIAANGGVQFLDVTVTGATNNMVCMVEAPGGLSNNSIVVKANYVSADTVRVYFVNPTASSVTLTPVNYRIACIKF